MLRRAVTRVVTGLCLLLAVSAEVPAQELAPPPAANASGSSDQPQLVSTGSSNFAKSMSYLLIVLLMLGSMWAVCRSSQRT